MLCRLTRRTLLPRPIVWNKSSGRRRGSLKGFRLLPYDVRLRQLGLHFLNRRRVRGDLVVAYNVFSGGLDLGPSFFFIPPVWPGLRGHSLQNGIPVCAIPTPNSLSYIIVLTLKFFLFPITLPIGGHRDPFWSIYLKA